MPQEEAEKDTANTGSLQQLLNLSGSNSLGLNTQGGFRTMRTEQHSMYTSCDVPATWNSLDSHRFVMLIPPHLLLRLSKGKCCHTGKKKLQLGMDGCHWCLLLVHYWEGAQKNTEKKLRKKKDFTIFLLIYGISPSWDSLD